MTIPEIFYFISLKGHIGSPAYKASTQQRANCNKSFPLLYRRDISNLSVSLSPYKGSRSLHFLVSFVPLIPLSHSQHRPEEWALSLGCLFSGGRLRDAWLLHSRHVWHLAKAQEKRWRRPRLRYRRGLLQTHTYNLLTIYIITIWVPPHRHRPRRHSAVITSGFDWRDTSAASQCVKSPEGPLPKWTDN